MKITTIITTLVKQNVYFNPMPVSKTFLMSCMTFPTLLGQYVPNRITIVKGHVMPYSLCMSH